MYVWNRQNWARMDAQAHLRAARAAPLEGLCDLVRQYDWDLFPEPVLGWVVAQKGIDLAGALTGFFNGTPERFNHLQKRDVPEAFQPAARTLDNICLRINCGFFTADPGAPATDMARLQQWMACQARDRKRGISGRWVLDERIVSALNGEADTAQTPGRASAAHKPRRKRRQAWLVTRRGNRADAVPHLPD